MRVFRRGVPAVLVILLSVLFLKGSTINVPTGTWQSTANMGVARANAVAVLVPDGRIVIAGGADATSAPTASAEAFSVDGTFSALPAMSVARARHAAIYTMTGDLLVTGGVTSGGGITNTAEVFDSLTNTWHSLSATMVESRAGHTMSQLQNGNVLVAGGENSSGPVAALEIYDITSGQFSFAGTLATARKGHAAAVLNDGRVLIIGGTTVQSDGTSATLASTEIYDPSTGQVTAGPNLATPRTNATATTLLDGRVLVLGGSYPEGANGAAPELASAEIYDPAANTFTTSASHLTTARAGHLAFLLPNNNNVLIVGGTNSQPDATSTLVSAPLASAELYTPWTDSFAPTQSMSTARDAATGSALSNTYGFGTDGLLLMAGGTNQNSAEVYGFATLKTDWPDYSPGQTVTITGTGWKPGETVTMTLVESPNLDTHPPITAIADASGNIVGQFVPDENDLGVRFYLTAVGQQSGLQVQNTFTDGRTLNSASLTYNSTTVPPGTLTVPAGATITATVNVTTDNGGGNQNWRSTGWKISTTAPSAGTLTCSNTPDHDGQGTYSESFSITAPVADGTYNAYFIAYSDQGCTNQPSNTLTLSNTVTVSSTVNTTTALASSVNPSVFGQGVTFTATVTQQTGAITPTGSVQFKIDGTNSGSPVTLVGGVATSSSIPSLSVAGSPHNIEAAYIPTGSFTASSNTLLQTVNKASQAITFTALANKTYGDAASTVTATGGASANPVTFTAGPVGVCTAGGTNGSTITIVGAGSCTVTAHQAGDTNYNAAPDVPQSFTINKRDATWTTNPNSKTYGDPDPDPLTTGSGTGFLAADNVTATYARAAGETVAGGPYHITATLAPAAVLSNYNVTNNGASFTINTKPATWTTNPASKTYGDADPSPLTTGSGAGFLAADNVTATYARAAGETVAGGPYHITATLSPSEVLSNYTITNAGSDFTINKRNATWTTNPASKTYGDADPNPLTTGSGSNFVPADNVTASYTRAAGETVAGGPYHITATLAPSGVLNNYNITNAGADFTINKRNATWTTSPASKTYGDADPNPLTTGSGSNFVAADNVTASYTRAAGETVAGGPYHITATLAPSEVLSNYIITNAGADLVINKRNATWTTNPGSKTYGDSDPNPLTTGNGTNFVDSVTATYSRASGETVAGGPYHITAVLSAAAGVLDNYIITNAGADFVINKRNATWTTNPGSKTYGDSDPDPLTTGSGTNFVDSVTATYSRASGETVAGGPYHIAAVLSAAAGVLDNYTITNAGADFTISKRAAIWTTNTNGKIYGDADPSPLTSGSGSNFVPADNVSATYSRVAGESVAGSPYHITATLSPGAVLDNYNITNAGADFTISKRDATWTTNPNSKTYGDADPNPLTTGSGSFLAADNVTASYTRVPGETVVGGPYHITAALNAAAGVLENYNVTNNGADFTINKRNATWTTNPNSKTYGDADPNPLTTGSGSFLAADNVTASYTRVPGETVVGGPYHITAALNAAAGVLENYNVTNNGADFTINKRNATWTTSPAGKVYGSPDPSPLTTGSGTNFVDPVSATYSRAAGETVLGGPYHITAVLSAGPGVFDNYTLTNAGADFTISQKPASVTPNNASKIFGAADPTPLTTGTLIGFLAADSVTATYSRTPGETVAGSPYTITATLSPAAVLTNYAITYNTAAFTISRWTLTGFYQPVTTYNGALVWNTIKGGQSVPLKFNIYAGTIEQKSIAAVQGGSVALYPVACASAGYEDPVEITNSGSTSLRYDSVGGQFIQNWQSPKGANLCYMIRMTAADGSKLDAYFKTK